MNRHCFRHPGSIFDERGAAVAHKHYWIITPRNKLGYTLDGSMLCYRFLSRTWRLRFPSRFEADNVYNVRNAKSLYKILYRHSFMYTLFSPFQIFPVNTKMYIVRCLCFVTKHLVLALVLPSSSSCSYMIFCLEHLSSSRKRKCYMWIWSSLWLLCAILCFIKFFRSPQDIEQSNYPPKRSRRKRRKKPFHFSFFVWLALCACFIGDFLFYFLC